MANKTENRPAPGHNPYDDQGGVPDDEELRRITGIGVGEEDQIDAAAQDESKGGVKGYAADKAKHKARGYATRKALEAGLIAGERGAFGERAKPLSELGREELKKAEKEGFDFNELHDPSWYKKQAGRGAKKGLKGFYRSFVKKHVKALLLTLLFPLLAAVALVVIFLFLAPLKHVYFEDIIRSANFARFQLIIRKQFTDVIFNAGVLTQDSVGNFRNSPLVRQLRLAVPNRQLEQLGRQGIVQWEFNDNRSFGYEVLPLRESLKAVVINGERFDLDEFARETFGQDYSNLERRQKWRVQADFVRTVGPELEKQLALLPRHVRWNPMFQFRQRTGIRLVKWLNAGRDLLGKSPQEVRAETNKNTVRQVMTPGGGQRSAISGINEGADETREAYVEASEEGRRPPGQIRGKIASQARVARGVSDAVFALTAYCIGRELVKLFTPEGLAERQAQAARMGALEMTASDQIKSGDTTQPAVNDSNSRWDGVEDVPDAANSVIYQRVTNQEPQGGSFNESSQTTGYSQQIPFLDPTYLLGDMRDEFQTYNDIAGPYILGGGPIVGPIFGVLSALGIDIGQKQINDSVCNAIMNEGVQYGIAIVELLATAASLGASKGVTAAIKGVLEVAFHFAVGYGLDQLLQLLIQWTIKEYAGLYFTGLEQGADRFNAAYVAENSIAQNSNRNVTFGRPLDQEETNEAQAVAMEALRAEHQQGSFAHRYFAMDNPYSLAGLTIAKMPVSSTGLAASVQNGLQVMGSIFSSPMRLLGSLGNILSPQPAHAAGVASTTTAFGVEQWGWSQAELQRIQEDPTFSLTSAGGASPSLLERVDPRLEDLNKRYGECYDDETFVLQVDRPDKCTKDFLSAGHPDHGDDALYWRYYRALLFAAEHLSGSL